MLLTLDHFYQLKRILVWITTEQGPPTGPTQAIGDTGLLQLNHDLRQIPDRILSIRGH